jgi:hypothetical protein
MKACGNVNLEQIQYENYIISNGINFYFLFFEEEERKKKKGKFHIRGSRTLDRSTW